MADLARIQFGGLYPPDHIEDTSTRVSKTLVENFDLVQLTPGMTIGRKTALPKADI